MKLGLLTIALTLLVQLFSTQAVAEPKYSMPWWAAMYDTEQVKVLVDTEALATEEPVGAPEATDTSEPVYLGYQGAGMGNVMGKPESFLEMGAATTVDAEAQMEAHLETLVNADLSVETNINALLDAAYIPVVEPFASETKVEPVFKDGPKFRGRYSVPSAKIVDEVLNAANGNDGSYNKFAVDAKTLDSADLLRGNHDITMADLKTELNEFEHFYWNNGGKYIPTSIMGGSFVETGVDADAEAHHVSHQDAHAALLAEIEAELNSEMDLEDELVAEGADAANAEDAHISLVETGVSVEDIPLHNPDMVPIPPRVQNIIDAHFNPPVAMVFPSIPVSIVKTPGKEFDKDGGFFEPRVGPGSNALANHILTRAAHVPTLAKDYKTQWLAQNATDGAGIVLQAHRDTVNKPFEEPKAMGIVEANLKPTIMYDRVNGTLVATVIERK